MKTWYYLVSLLPFEWAEPERMIFFKNALLAIMVMTILFGLLSTMIVNNKLAFFSESLGHGAFTGIVIGNLMGFVDPLGSAIVFAILFACIVSVVRVYAKMSSDTVIGVFSSLSVALGIFLATLGGGNFNKLNSLLIGDLMSVQPWEIGMMFVVLLLVLLYFLNYFNGLLLLSVNQAIARSRGKNPIIVETVFAIVIAIVVTLAIDWVGMLLINALLILPAAISRNIAINTCQYMLFSVVISFFAGVSGILGAFYLGSASSALIVLVLGLCFGISFIASGRAS